MLGGCRKPKPRMVNACAFLLPESWCWHPSGKESINSLKANKMKKLLVFLLLMCSASISAQDVIVKKDGSTIVSKVLEVGQDVIKYKKFNNLDGPTYSISKLELQSINYQNGAKDTFSAPVREENRFLPNNQNNGESLINDKALLKMDNDLNIPLKKLKTKRILNWIGGIICGGIGSYFMGLGISNLIEGDSELLWAVGIGAVGITGGALFIKNGIKNTNQIKNMESNHFVLNEFKFKNDTFLNTSIDFLQNQALNTQTIGIGVQYNF